eukprot:65641_1
MGSHQVLLFFSFCSSKLALHRKALRVSGAHLEAVRLLANVAQVAEDATNVVDLGHTGALQVLTPVHLLETAAVGTTQVDHHVIRAADEDHGHLVLGGGQPGVEVGLVHVTHGTLPGVLVLRSHTVDDVVVLEAALGVLLQVVEHTLQQNLVLGLVTVAQRHLGGVGRVAAHLADHLQHRGDAGAAADETQVGPVVGAVLELVVAAAELKAVTRLHGVEALGHAATGLLLDEEVKVALLAVGGDRGVGALHVLGIRGQGVALVGLQGGAGGQVELSLWAAGEEAEDGGVLGAVEDLPQTVLVVLRVEGHAVVVALLLVLTGVGGLDAVSGGTGGHGEGGNSGKAAEETHFLCLLVFSEVLARTLFNKVQK